jgi:bifunctional UDP-N-acetylglucosamine pyrophosphorylase/glucosamine-1-phosphate N-acetyltransferase
MEQLKAVILAAGAGTRMKSNLPKVIHKIIGKPMIDYAIEAAIQAGATKVCVIVGHKSELVEAAVNYDVEFVYQEEQLGTGHAVMQATDFIGDDGNVLILFGDTPLVTSDTLKEMVNYHRERGNAVTLLSTNVEDPFGYGRIIRDENQNFVKSVEHKDATEEEQKVREINSGMYCFSSKHLLEALKTLDNHNAQGEYYLPDTLISIMEKGLKVGAMVTEKYEDILGVNSRVDLARATQIMKNRINQQHMLNGVTMIDPDNTYISPDVTIEMDTIIYPNTMIEGKSSIGAGAMIGPNAKIVDSQIGDESVIDQSTVLNSVIGNSTMVGPYAYIRPNCQIGNQIKIGDFVEVKNATIGDHTKVSHLTYIGDADVGCFVNFGCGTVVVNYDGVEKHRTTIEDHAFIGCNTNLVSPVKVGENAYTAAGSTITKEVAPYALGIARAKQMNINDWVKRKR